MHILYIIYQVFISYQVSYIKIFTAVHSNQDLIWWVKIGVYMSFWVNLGS